MDKIIKKYCPTCADYKDCPYRLRNLESKCSQLSDVAYGYELAEQDLALTWEDVAKIITIYEAGIDNGDYRRYNEAEWMKEYSQDILRRFNELKQP